MFVFFHSFPLQTIGTYAEIETPLPYLICLFSFLHDSVIRSLQELLDYPGEDIEETFCLNFTVRISSLLMIAAPMPISQNSRYFFSKSKNKFSDFSEPNYFSHSVLSSVNVLNI